VTNHVDLVRDTSKLKNYSKIILPGVGAFGDAIKRIRKKGIDKAIFEEVNKGKYLLGICLGMQLLATKSYEHGEFNGLDLIEGEVVNFRNKINNLRIPHIGWNEVEMLKDDKILKSIENRSDFYFLHSYYYKCWDSSQVVGVTNYGIKYPSIINKDNIYGVQFHPEKSQEAGLRLMKNFIEL
jgi:glutamine amidotransferase